MKNRTRRAAFPKTADGTLRRGDGDPDGFNDAADTRAAMSRLGRYGIFSISVYAVGAS